MPYKIRLVHRPQQENNEKILEQISNFDKRYFPNCKLEPVVDNYWWFIYFNGDIVGYAGMMYLADEKYGYFSRAAVAPEHRGNKLHTRLISTRIRMCKRLGGLGVITYVLPTNTASANSLIDRKFKLYTPQRRWAGSNFLYFCLEFKNNGTKQAQK